MDELLRKKLADYKIGSYDFVAHGELTVTITLAEYRELLKKSALYEEAIKK